MIFLQIFWGYCLDPDSNSYWLVLVSLLAKENVLKGNFAVKSNKQASKQANKQTKTKQRKTLASLDSPADEMGSSVGPSQWGAGSPGLPPWAHTCHLSQGPGDTEKWHCLYPWRVHNLVRVMAMNQDYVTTDELQRDRELQPPALHTSQRSE